MCIILVAFSLTTVWTDQQRCNYVLHPDPMFPKAGVFTPHCGKVVHSCIPHYSCHCCCPYHSGAHAAISPHQQQWAARSLMAREVAVGVCPSLDTTASTAQYSVSATSCCCCHHPGAHSPGGPPIWCKLLVGTWGWCLTRLPLVIMLLISISHSYIYGMLGIFCSFKSWKFIMFVELLC